MHQQVGSVTQKPPNICQVVFAFGHNFSSLTSSFQALLYRIYVKPSTNPFIVCCCFVRDEWYYYKIDT